MSDVTSVRSRGLVLAASLVSLAAAGPIAAQQAASAPIEVGSYDCVRSARDSSGASRASDTRESLGRVTLMADGVYQWRDHDPSGRFTYNERTREIQWVRGKFAGTNPATIFTPSAPNGAAWLEMTFPITAGRAVWRCTLAPR